MVLKCKHCICFNFSPKCLHVQVCVAGRGESFSYRFANFRKINIFTPERFKDYFGKMSATKFSYITNNCVKKISKNV